MPCFDQIITTFGQLIQKLWTSDISWDLSLPYRYHILHIIPVWYYPSRGYCSGTELCEASVFLCTERRVKIIKVSLLPITSSTVDDFNHRVLYNTYQYKLKFIWLLCAQILYNASTVMNDWFEGPPSFTKIWSVNGCIAATVEYNFTNWI